MDLIPDNSFPEHLLENIIIKVNPKYIHIGKKFFKVPSQYEKIWYNLFPIETRDSHDPEMYLLKSLKIEYYDLFDHLFDQFILNIGTPSSSLLNKLLMTSLLNGNIDYINKFISFGAKTKEDVEMRKAAWKGHPDVVEIMLKRGATDYQRTMELAALFGRMNIVKMMLSKGADNYEETMVSAGMGPPGSMNIFNMMFNKGARSYNQALRNAAWAGRGGSVRWISFFNPSNYEEAFIEAVRNNDFEMVEFISNKKSITNDYMIDGVKIAVEEGNASLAEFIMCGDVNISNCALRIAARYGHTDIVETALLNSATDYEEAIEEAEKSGLSVTPDVIKMIKKHQIAEK